MNLSKRQFLLGLGTLGTAGMTASVSPVFAQTPPLQEINQGAESNNSVVPVGSIFNVKDFGAKGDGKTADSSAIQAALDAAGQVRGTVYFPSGHYLCHDLKVRSFTTVYAEPKWAYGQEAGVMLTLDSEEADCLLDITDTFGVHIRGGLLRGNRGAAKEQHGIMFNNAVDFSKGENAPVLDEVAVHGFSGHGVYLRRIWLFIIRHSIFKSNGGHGVCIYGWDGFVTDNQFSDNGKSGFGTEENGSTVMFTANRVEWNREYGLFLQFGDAWNVTGNCFDRNWGAGVYLNKVIDATITGNVFRRNGKDSTKLYEGLDESCQILLRNCRGISLVGNSGVVRRDDGAGIYTPNYVYWFKNNSCSVVSGNAFSGGYLKEEVMDQGNADDFLFVNNVASQFVLPPDYDNGR
ncbi:MAG: right-handed parallel beta-helix repeat-containing protein [Thermoguttaceae bacterium]